MNEETEVRSFSFNIVEQEDRLKVSGIAIPFNSKSEVLGDFQEIIEKKAVNNTSLNNTFLLYNHDFNNILASKNSDSLKLEIRDEGLYFEADIIDNVRGNDTYDLIKRGDLNQMSFSMSGIRDTWDFTKDIPIRKINNIGLIREISVVSNPAYKETKVSTRSINFKNECMDCKIEKSKKQAMVDEMNNIINSTKLK